MQGVIVLGSRVAAKPPTGSQLDPASSLYHRPPVALAA